MEFLFVSLDLNHVWCERELLAVVCHHERSANTTNHCVKRKKSNQQHPVPKGLRLMLREVQ